MTNNFFINKLILIKVDFFTVKMLDEIVEKFTKEATEFYTKPKFTEPTIEHIIYIKQKNTNQKIYSVINFDLTLEILIKQCWLSYFGNMSLTPNFNELIIITKEYLSKITRPLNYDEFYPKKELFNDLKIHYTLLEKNIFHHIRKLCNVIISFWKKDFNFEDVEIFNINNLIFVLRPTIINDRLKFEPVFENKKNNHKKIKEQNKKLGEQIKKLKDQINKFVDQINKFKEQIKE